MDSTVPHDSVPQHNERLHTFQTQWEDTEWTQFPDRAALNKIAATQRCVKDGRPWSLAGPLIKLDDMSAFDHLFDCDQCGNHALGGGQFEGAIAHSDWHGGYHCTWSL